MFLHTTLSFISLPVTEVRFLGLTLHESVQKSSVSVTCDCTSKTPVYCDFLEDVPNKMKVTINPQHDLMYGECKGYCYKA